MTQSASWFHGGISTQTLLIAGTYSIFALVVVLSVPIFSPIPATSPVSIDSLNRQRHFGSYRFHRPTVGIYSSSSTILNCEKKWLTYR